LRTVANKYLLVRSTTQSILTAAALRLACQKVMISSLILAADCRKQIFPFERISIQLRFTNATDRGCARAPNVRGRINADLPKPAGVSILSRIRGLQARKQYAACTANG